MPPCVEPRCPALAVDGERCAVHARGLRLHHVATGDENTLRCADCAKLVRSGDWYLFVDGRVTHAGDCLRPND